MAEMGDKKQKANGNTDRHGRGHIPCPNCSAPIPIKTSKRPLALKCSRCSEEDQWIMIYNKVSKTQ